MNEGLNKFAKLLIFLTFFMFAGTFASGVAQELDVLDRQLMSEEEVDISESELTHKYVTLTLRVEHQFQTKHPLEALPPRTEDQPPRHIDQLVIHILAINAYGKTLKGSFVFEKGDFEKLPGAILSLKFLNHSYGEMVMPTIWTDDPDYEVNPVGVPKVDYFKNKEKIPAIYYYGLMMKP